MPMVELAVRRRLFLKIIHSGFSCTPLGFLLGQFFSGRWAPSSTTSSTGLISAFVTVTDALRRLPRLL